LQYGVTRLEPGKLSSLRTITALTLVLWASPAAAQTADTILQRAGAYLATYERQMSMIVSEEVYAQSTRGGGRNENLMLKSDILIVDLGTAGWVGFRDVFEVNGQAIRDHQNRLLALVLSPAPDALDQARRMSEEGARFNVGSITRTINMPTAALMFLRATEQSRSTWALGGRKKIQGREVIELRFDEQETPRVILTRDNAAARGRFWIEPDSGRIVRSELFIDSGAVSAEVLVTFGPVPRIAPWVPLSMDDVYRSTRRDGLTGGSRDDLLATGSRGVIDGHATYRNFRTFTVETNTVISGVQVRTADPAKRGIPVAEFPRLVPLGAGIYGYEELRSPGFTTVSLIVVGKTGVLIADGQGNAAATQKMLDKIRTVTDLPVRWYVAGSDHGDHTGGNSVLPPNVTFVVHSASRLQTPVPAPAAMTSDRQVIDVGGLSVEVLFLGRAHTGGDLSVYVPRDKLLFMSEAFLNRVFPAMRTAYPSEWVRTIDRALAMDVARFVPGHGFIEEPKASREELIAFKDALVAVIAEVKRLHALGLSADDAIKQANWGPYKDWFLMDQQAPIAVRRVYDEIEGRLKL
jgi:glyoxylase-like metal-dependent hydrolase (beta-lactamase superfamily II)